MSKYLPAKGQVCSVAGCGAAVRCKLLCSKHYDRALFYGDPLAGGPVRSRWKGATCRASKCSRPIWGRGYCSMHLKRLAAHGDPEKTLQAPKGTGTITPDGYRMIAGQLEHRSVMERSIGRKLLPNENVHHKNGQRADSRPENLELWSTAQPSGQSIADKLAFAREIIAQYEGTVVDPNPPTPAVMDPTELRDVMERMLRKQLQKPLSFPVSA